jgi:hypothetical protein
MHLRFSAHGRHRRVAEMLRSGWCGLQCSDYVDRFLALVFSDPSTSPLCDNSCSGPEKKKITPSKTTGDSLHAVNTPWTGGPVETRSSRLHANCINITPIVPVIGVKQPQGSLEFRRSDDCLSCLTVLGGPSTFRPWTDR